MELKRKMLMSFVLSAIATSGFLMIQNAFATNSGLKVNLSADTDGASGSGEYCVSGGGNTECQNASVPGEVQVNLGSVDEGESLKGCVDFEGNVKCDSGENTSCKCPENLHVRFGGNNQGGSSSASSSSSSSTSSSSSSSSIGDIIINNLEN